jgi:hypothetical protein
MMIDRTFQLAPYLAESEYIDWKHALVAAKAAELAGACKSDGGRLRKRKKSYAKPKAMVVAT